MEHAMWAGMGTDDKIAGKNEVVEVTERFEMPQAWAFRQLPADKDLTHEGCPYSTLQPDLSLCPGYENIC